jgi:ParB family protein of integrating conjugative element (PFGI_1 class)
MNPIPSLDPRADADDSFSILPIGEVETYEYNPRTGNNPRYDDIRASIIADGITNPITVTRRPESSKYHPYGGGNTRLSIAKELQASGDTRFNTLKVIVKAWPGDANVISAHLAENENRGDISFWEKAQGVATFKKAHEKEHGAVLSTGDLGRELKSHGINFGVRVIQNFAFAVEHLSPIGPWLKATEVNEILRPAISGAMTVATKFDVQRSIFEPVLLKHRDQVLATITYNKEAEESQRKPVELDAADLVADLHEALAMAVGVTPEIMPLMISAVESNSRITSEELKAIQIRKPVEPKQSPAPNASNASASQGQQRVLTGMLAGVPPAPAAPPTPPTNQTPAVRSASQASMGQEDQSVPIVSSLQRNPGLPENVGTDDPTAHVLSLVLDISDLALLHDCILHVKDMPFGYCMDLPKNLEQMGDEALPDGQVQIRAASWKFLASLSGQLDPQWFTHVSEDISNWTRFAKAGPDVFRQNYVRALRGVTADSGDPAMLLAEVYVMFSQTELGYLTVQLLRAMEQLRLDHPERFVRAVTPDPDLPQ